jgi:glutathione S-transferase
MGVEAMTEADWPVSIIDRVLDGRNHNLTESDGILRVLNRTEDGHTIEYAYRGFRFTVERGWLMWWCHSGYSRRGSLMCTAHEAGWGSLTRRAVVRKVTRAIRSDERKRARRFEMGETW